tara:strand:- start:19 stop:492 length:474 start_codon:yes stop_codon:yes gene_type:complete
MKKLNFYLLPFIVLFLISCGFKVENYSKLSNFKISEISTQGDKRINYKLKNALLFQSSKNSSKLINIELQTNKNKTIKEKNIKNEITKYKIDISVDVIFNKISSKTKNSFNISRSGNFKVATQYSQTLNNEKKLIEMLTDKISQEIFNKLVLESNAI